MAAGRLCRLELTAHDDYTTPLLPGLRIPLKKRFNEQRTNDKEPRTRPAMNAADLKKLLCIIGVCWPVRSLARPTRSDAGLHTHVMPILKKYCTGCHNADDKEGVSS